MTDAPDPLVLTSKQRAALRAQAHGLKPTLHVGKEGVTDAARRALDQAFANQALVKIRVLETAPETARDTAEALSGQASTVVQVAGRNAVLYRPQPEDESTKRKKSPKLTPGGRPPGRKANNRRKPTVAKKSAVRKVTGKGAGTRKTYKKR